MGIYGFYKLTFVAGTHNSDDDYPDLDDADNQN